MRNNGIFAGKLTAWIAVSLTVAAAWPGLSFGQAVFFDSFDSGTVGTMPSTWTTNTTLGAPHAPFYITNNIPGTPTSPNVAAIVNTDTGATFNVRRDFPTYSLNVVSQLVISYRFNMSIIPGGGSRGPLILPSGAISQGEETFAAMRVVSGSLPGTWAVLNPSAALTNNIPLNTWHDFRFEIDPSATNARNGVVRWYFDNQLFHTENFLTPDLPRTNISALVVRDYSYQFPGSYATNTFYLDNVYVYAEIPEPSSLGLVVLAALGLGGWRNARRRP